MAHKILLALAGVAAMSPIHALCQTAPSYHCKDHPWEKSLPEGRSYSELHRRPVASESVAPVVAAAVDKTIERLEKMPAVAVSLTEAQLLTGKELRASPRERLFLVRALRYTMDGEFSVYKYGSEVMISFMDPGFLRPDRQKTEVKQWPIIASLPVESLRFYVVCSVSVISGII